MIDLPEDLQVGGRDESAKLTEKTGGDVGISSKAGVTTVTFDTPDQIDVNDLDVWDWILNDYFPDGTAGEYEVVEGSVKIGMHEGYYVKKEIARRIAHEDGTASWDKDRTSGIQRMYRYSARIQRRAGVLPKLVRADLDAAIKASKKKARTRRKNHGVDCMVVVLADVQLGKTQKGMGTPENLIRVRSRMLQAAEWAKELKPKRIALVNTGDILENCFGFYPTQTYDVDLNNREQFAAGVHVVSEHLDVLAPLCEELIFASAPSNHGEFRVGTGKTLTDPAIDNKDLMLADMIAELAPHRWTHLTVEVPHKTEGEPYLASFTTGQNERSIRIGVVHGHQMGTSGASPIQKLSTWWSNNIGSDLNRPRDSEGIFAEHCHILIAGHYHHFGIHTGKSRMILSAPASDLGSGWYESRMGIMNPAGLLCFSVDESNPHYVDQTRIFASA